MIIYLNLNWRWNIEMTLQSRIQCTTSSTRCSASQTNRNNNIMKFSSLLYISHWNASEREWEMCTTLACKWNFNTTKNRLRKCLRKLAYNACQVYALREPSQPRAVYSERVARLHGSKCGQVNNVESIRHSRLQRFLYSSATTWRTCGRRRIYCTW